MCVAVTGKIISINGKTASVDFGGNRVNARMGLTPAAVGDRVLVHAGCILQKVSDEDAELMEELFGTEDNI